MTLNINSLKTKSVFFSEISFLLFCFVFFLIRVVLAQKALKENLFLLKAVLKE